MNTWDQRARRARFLADSFPASQEILNFYSGVAEWQGRVATRLSAFRSFNAFSAFNHLPAVLPSLLELVRRTAPPDLARAAQEFDMDEAGKLLRDYWSTPDTVSAVSTDEFFARAVLQPYAANLPDGLDCSWCAQPAQAPQAGCLRPQGDGLAFELVCPLCLRRRAFPRTRCPGCNESSESKLASFSTEEYPHLRLLSCDNCKSYLIVVDLERDLAAIPEVDELAALPLDLWAIEHGYHKLQPNLAGV